ncbi:MAG: NADH-ubiquinone oxidoreductase-F iron-sulfur binding region domain-containing protein [Acidimicrobiales bacterium]
MPRLLRGWHRDGRPMSLSEHVAIHGAVPAVAGRRRGGDALVEVVGRAGLCGRGGAGFPTARKMASVAGRRGRPVVVANGAEGEPASAKDRVLVGQNPHLVLDGAALAAAAVGASRVIVAVTSHNVATVTGAMSERARLDLDRVPLEVIALPERFIAGEESALVDFVNGGPGLPGFVPPRPYERGVGGQPTLVHNVETLAHLALIARHGPGWFRGVGTASEPGSTLVTVTGAVAQPGVLEVPRGARLGDVIGSAGGPSARSGAYLIGGYAGAWMPALPRTWVMPLSEEALRRHGGILGAGVVVVLPLHACGVSETARIMAYLAAQGAGQCGPCVNGLAAMASAAGDLALGTAGGDVVEWLERWAGQVRGRGACRHPDGAARLMASALATFATDVSAHRRHQPCRGASAPPAWAGSTGGALPTAMSWTLR